MKYIACLLLICTVYPVYGQFLWLQPGKFNHNTGDTVVIHFKGDRAGNDSLKSLVWCDGTRAENIMNAATANVDSFYVPLSVSSTQTVIAGLQDDTTTMKATVFNTMLEQYGLTELLDNRKKSNKANDDVSVSIFTIAKTVFQVGAQKNDLCNGSAKLDVFFENNPYDFNNLIMNGGARPYMGVGVKASFNGQPLANQRLILFKQNADGFFNSSNLRTNRKGRENVFFDIPGNYVLSCVYVEKDTGSNVYKVYNTTLNFGSKGNFFVKRRVREG